MVAADDFFFVERDVVLPCMLKSAMQHTSNSHKTKSRDSHTLNIQVLGALEAGLNIVHLIKPVHDFPHVLKLECTRTFF